MRVLIADDHALVRAGIRALVADLPEVSDIVEAADGYEAVSAVASHRPDLVLMDITMPRMTGFEATTRILAEFPKTKVIVLSMHRNEEYVQRALHSGAAGYLLKDASVEELRTAVQTVASGGAYVSPQIKRDEREPLLEQLSPRQREVLLLIAEGRTNREIAQLLSVHIKTVESHRTHLMKRLDIHDIAGLVRFAIRQGLISEQ